MEVIVLFRCSLQTPRLSLQPLKGAVSAQKALEELQTTPNEGSLICPPGKLMIFYIKEIEKIELVARPGQCPPSTATLSGPPNSPPDASISPSGIQYCLEQAVLCVLR